MLLSWSVSALAFASCVIGSDSYSESLHLKPLPRNKLLSSFRFQSESLPFEPVYHNESHHSGEVEQREKQMSHYSFFPSSLGPIIASTNTRDLSLRFTQGWWDAKSWGKLPGNGANSGGTGVEVVAVIEAPSIQAAKQSWSKLTKILSGFFCASLNSIEEDTTTFPRYAVEQMDPRNYRPQVGNKLYLLRAALPSEPVCTENLTPFLKLLPTRGKAGVASLLDGHKVFDSLWHGMSIDIHTECNSSGDGTCKWELHQTVNQVIDVIRSIRKHREGGIPKPVQGEKLRCDASKKNNIWQCFPLGDPTELSWSLETLYGRTINGPAFEDDEGVTVVTIDVDRSAWNVTLKRSSSDAVMTNDLHGDIFEIVREPFKHDFIFFTNDSTKVGAVESPPLYVSRSLTGYSLDKGGLRVAFTNPSAKAAQLKYFESVPWFMRLYMSTLELSLWDSQSTRVVHNHSEIIKNNYYRPSVDRQRPSHWELDLEVPANSTLRMTYDFDKSLLFYREYPPDANHGFDVEPAVILVKDDSGNIVYDFRTTSLLLTLPTPDFSMPYNVIILTCTVLSLAFGIVFNLLTKKTVTEEEFERVSQNTKFAKFKAFIQSKLVRKSKVD
ncbi:uncharacterized protein LODBEIA_P52000 [Lodderomyces beijingensis]|uniref:GPI transamidase component GPI16 n=1 Tax=Lodderomyces beijingensis TaxID=1775926 RepID=A0ABP0ZS65_9ASCO